MAEKKKKSKSTTKKKKTGGKKKATSTMAKCAKAWNKSSKSGKYTDFVKKFFKANY